MDLLKDRDSNVRSAGARALGELAGHRVWRCVPHSLTTLMVHFQPLSTTRSRILFLRSLIYSRRASWMSDRLVNMPWRNWLSTVCDDWCHAVSRDSCLFLATYRSAIPWIIEFLQHRDSYFQRIGAKRFNKWQAECMWRCLARPLLKWCPVLATFHKIIKSLVPQIISLPLKDSDPNGESAGANKLTEQGMW